VAGISKQIGTLKFIAQEEASAMNELISGLVISDEQRDLMMEAVDNKLDATAFGGGSSENQKSRLAHLHFFMTGPDIMGIFDPENSVRSKLVLVAQRLHSIRLGALDERTYAHATTLATYNEPAFSKEQGHAYLQDLKILVRSSCLPPIVVGSSCPQTPEDLQTEYPALYKTIYSVHPPLGTKVYEHISVQGLALRATMIPCRIHRGSAHSVAHPLASEPQDDQLPGLQIFARPRRQSPSPSPPSDVKARRRPSMGETAFASMLMGNGGGNRQLSSLPDEGAPHRLALQDGTADAAVGGAPLDPPTPAPEAPPAPQPRPAPPTPKAPLPLEDKQDTAAREDQFAAPERPRLTAQEVTNLIQKKMMKKDVGIKEPAAAPAAKTKAGKKTPMKAKAKAKVRMLKRPAGKVTLPSVLGCSKCRGSPNGCGTCKDPEFKGKRGVRPTQKGEIRTKKRRSGV
jgi:hypothetical protein